MKTEEFNGILRLRLEKIGKVLGSKAEEYAHGGDRLHNFKIAGRILGVNQVNALWGMAVKHLVCIQDLVDGNLEPEPAMIDEKIGDMINYLILLEAALLEQS